MSAFAVTFLGHQGWLVRTERTCILIDPLLREPFGDVHALGYRMYPPRVLRSDAFPPIDAVFVSHEHDDHFDVASLARLARDIPIHLSAHSSSAAFAILREMGFGVHALAPGAPVTIGDLEFVPLTGDHVSVNCADEWDALPFLVHDRARQGSLFSTVDVALMPQHIAWAKAIVPRPGIVTWSNNTLDWSHMSDATIRDVGTEESFQRMGTDHKHVMVEWGIPAAMVMCAGGFSFEGERAWLNDRVFWVDDDAVCRRLTQVYPHERFAAAIPGQTFVMRAQRLAQVDAETPFLGTLPRNEWPHRGRVPTTRVPDYAPACGRRTMTANDRTALDDALRELARALVGGILFRSLHSMLAPEAGARRPTFALVLRDGTDVAAFEYDASACAFRPLEHGDPRTTHLAGFECWATDLLAVAGGEIGPIALMFGRARTWNALPQRFHFDLLEGLTRISHPLSRPDAFLASYRRLYEACRADPPAFAGPAGDSAAVRSRVAAVAR